MSAIGVDGVKTLIHQIRRSGFGDHSNRAFSRGGELFFFFCLWKCAQQCGPSPEEGVGKVSMGRGGPCLVVSQ